MYIGVVETTRLVVKLRFSFAFFFFANYIYATADRPTRGQEKYYFLILPGEIYMPTCVTEAFLLFLPVA